MIAHPEYDSVAARVFPSSEAAGLFACTELVRRLDMAEAHTLEEIVLGCAGGSFRLPIGGGMALHRGGGSPFDKVIGVGFAPLEEDTLTQVERAYAVRGARPQFELSTHADPAITNRLVQRGYRLTGFENVLVRSLDTLCDAEAPKGLTVRRALGVEREAWIDVLVGAAAEPTDDAPVAEHDDFARAVVERAVRDMAHQPCVTQWLATRKGEVVGGASLCMRDGIAQLMGAATRPTARRCGVQTALLAARMSAARAAGCTLAVVTTQPGTGSQRNVQRAGFTQLYARAIWRR